MSLAACLDTLIRAGPIHYSRLIYFRGLDTYLQFAINEDLRDQAEQQEVGYSAMIRAVYALPTTVAVLLLLSYLADLFWQRRGSSQYARARQWLLRSLNAE